MRTFLSGLRSCWPGWRPARSWPATGWRSRSARAGWGRAAAGHVIADGASSGCPGACLPGTGVRGRGGRGRQSPEPAPGHSQTARNGHGVFGAALVRCIVAPAMLLPCEAQRHQIGNDAVLATSGRQRCTSPDRRNYIGGATMQFARAPGRRIRPDGGREGWCRRRTVVQARHCPAEAARRLPPGRGRLAMLSGTGD